MVNDQAQQPVRTTRLQAAYGRCAAAKRPTAAPTSPRITSVNWWEAADCPLSADGRAALGDARTVLEDLQHILQAVHDKPEQEQEYRQLHDLYRRLSGVVKGNGRRGQPVKA